MTTHARAAGSRGWSPARASSRPEAAGAGHETTSSTRPAARPLRRARSEHFLCLGHLGFIAARCAVASARVCPPDRKRTGRDLLDRCVARMMQAGEDRVRLQEYVLEADVLHRQLREHGVLGAERRLEILLQRVVANGKHLRLDDRDGARARSGA